VLCDLDVMTSFGVVWIVCFVMLLNVLCVHLASDDCVADVYCDYCCLCAV